jgi:alpha/beta superfamily hydrolase
MESNVVLAVCDALASLSIAGLRFNFRGAGGSGGSHGGGVKERDDVRTALDYLCTRSEVDKNRLGLVGYSFGGAVVFAVARQDTRIKRLALVSPALDESGWEELKGFPRPKLILLGDADTTVPYTRWKKYFSDDRDFQIVTGADHFWWGFEGEIKKRVGGFFPHECG